MEWLTAFSGKSGADPKKVAVYVRWSTDEQESGNRLEVQTESCQYFILSQGWAFNRDLVFVDDGFSGGNVERPALTRLRKMVQDGQIHAVVVYKLDPLSRRVVETGSGRVVRALQPVLDG